MRINVTQEHISRACPVALAMSETGFLGASVRLFARGPRLSYEAVWGPKGDERWILLPRTVEDRIRAYDRSRLMVPFSFEIEVTP